jgi:hypothetical protein
MSIDVAEGAAVAFDRYETEDGTRESEYGKYMTREGKKYDVNISYSAAME